MSDTVSPAPTLLTLRDTIDARWPSRSKASDGIMGDAAHQARASDHNQGNAFDVTHDATNGPDLDALADVLIQDARTRYVIWNRRIRNRAFNAGAWRPYSGASPHTEHLHISVFAELRDDTSPWKLSAEEPPAGEPPVSTEGSRHVAVFFAGVGLLAAVALLVRHAAHDDRARRRRTAWS